MKNDKYAVAVGYRFGLIPAHELHHIVLTEQDTCVRYDGENWNLYKAKTYADSRYIDDLLDRYGDHSISEHQIEPVIMTGSLEMTLPGFNKDRDSLLFGGYAFMCSGKVLPVDFSGIAWDIQQQGDHVSVSFETGRTPFGKDYFLDDCFEEEYRALGLRMESITAELLAGASQISEFMVSLEQNGAEYSPEDIARRGSFHLKALAFENGKYTYAVSQDVLAAFNERLNAPDKTQPFADKLKGAQARTTTAQNPDAKCKPDPER